MLSLRTSGAGAGVDVDLLSVAAANRRPDQPEPAARPTRRVRAVGRLSRSAATTCTSARARSRGVRACSAKPMATSTSAWPSTHCTTRRAGTTGRLAGGTRPKRPLHVPLAKREKAAILLFRGDTAAAAGDPEARDRDLGGSPCLVRTWTSRLGCAGSAMPARGSRRSRPCAGSSPPTPRRSPMRPSTRCSGARRPGPRRLQGKMIATGAAAIASSRTCCSAAVCAVMVSNVTPAGACRSRPPSTPRARPRTWCCGSIFPEGPFLADVGFGNLAPTTALQLRRTSSRTRRTSHALHRHGRELVLQSKLGDRWEHIYRVVLLPRVDAEYDICNWFTASHPRSPTRTT